jgi:hypothetical protein
MARGLALGLIHIGAVFRLVLLTVIDPAGVIGCVQPLPRIRLVGMNDCAAGDVLPDQRHRVALTRHDERQGPPHDLTRHNYDLALTGLSFGEPAVNAIGLAILRRRKGDSNCRSLSRECRLRAGYDAFAVVAVRMSALRLSAAIRPSMPWLFRIAENSEWRVATSLIAPSR